MKAATSPELISYMVNRPAQGMFPDSKLASQVEIEKHEIPFWTSSIIRKRFLFGFIYKIIWDRILAQTLPRHPRII